MVRRAGPGRYGRPLKRAAIYAARCISIKSEECEGATGQEGRRVLEVPRESTKSKDYRRTCLEQDPAKFVPGEISESQR